MATWDLCDVGACFIGWYGQSTAVNRQCSDHQELAPAWLASTVFVTFLLVRWLCFPIADRHAETLLNAPVQIISTHSQPSAQVFTGCCCSAVQEAQPQEAPQQHWQHGKG